MFSCTYFRITVWGIPLFLALQLYLLPAFAMNAEPVSDQTVIVQGIHPVQPAPELKPGLAVLYYVGFAKRDLRGLPKAASLQYRSFAGKPITHLDHAFGRGKVFASGESQKVGMRMHGYLHFKRVGTYLLQALSNDGIFVEIDGKSALSDPRQHSDRLSNRAEVKVESPGWYPVKIEYFQRKGTATLRLLWQEPGGQEMVPVPAEAYGHLPQG